MTTPTLKQMQDEIAKLRERVAVLEQQTIPAQPWNIPTLPFEPWKPTYPYEIICGAHTK